MFGVFVLWKALVLIPLLPILTPVFAFHAACITANQALYAFVGFLHLTEVLYWGTCFFTQLVFFPLFPIIHFVVYPPAVVFSFIQKGFMAVIVFFTFPIAYLLSIWHSFHKLHMHLNACWLILLKLLNL